MSTVPAAWVGSTITVGTTEFTVEFLGEVWPQLRDTFERRGIQLKIEHVRTRDLRAKLDAEQVDLVCGSFAAERDRGPDVPHDFLEWHRERVALLTNLSVRELPDRPVARDALAALPLLTPTAGLLADFLTRWYGPEYRGKLHVVADIDALNYGLNLLSSKLMFGCLLTTERVADAAVEGRIARREPPQGRAWNRLRTCARDRDRDLLSRGRAAAVCRRPSAQLALGSLRGRSTGCSRCSA